MSTPVPLPPHFGQNGFEPARTICRGAIRLLHDCGYASVIELPLPSGRRADIAAIGARGEIWIVEVKSCLNDFRTDSKWTEYRAHCDRLFFAVDNDFPADVLPPDAGLMIVDGYGGAILREAPAHPLVAASRKAMTMRIARIAASRLSTLHDPKIRQELL
ncbi:MAG: MmcB family DNA repair protein [Xanthobacteraceae bacterium]|nr:MmcB family DNA repair protein [Xanthobacteraceae bacterium]QYK45140.1 MAG: MmcB family DNA repair protein [Xanthobacteraceae bacterium]